MADEINNIKILWDSGAIDTQIKKMAQSIVNRWDREPVINLVPVITGGMMFASKLMTELESIAPGKWVVNPLIASSYQYSYDPNKPEVVKISDYESKFKDGSPTIILDDLIDSGITLSIIKDLIKNITNGNVEIAVLVDKTAKRASNIYPEYYCFDIEEDYWLVGFGMDDKGLFRGMDSVGYLNQQIKLL
ncbi:MAG: phosphoribosyltransferase family protein [Dehalococcoidia bacterium]